MYHITASPFGPYTQIILENKISQTGFSLVPAEGGTVCDLWFNGQSVLDGHNTPEALQGGKWGKSSVLFPFPNRMLDGKYTWEGQEYQFPITNKDTGNAIHGFVRHLAFEVVAQEAKSDAASITVALKYDGHLAYYPFPFLLELRFTIQDNGIFEMHTAITNLHHHAIPVGFGWHPYFRLTPKSNDTKMQIPTCQKVDIDPRMIPTGELTRFDLFSTERLVADTFLDNCFLAESDYTISASGTQFELEVSADAALFPYFQIFTPPHRESIAIEPMTCNVDAFNNGNGLIRLEAGAKWAGAFHCRIRLVPPKRSK